MAAAVWEAFMKVLLSVSGTPWTWHHIFILKEGVRKRQTKQRHLFKALFCLLSLMLSDTRQYSAGWCLHGNVITAIYTYLLLTQRWGNWLPINPESLWGFWYFCRCIDDKATWQCCYSSVQLCFQPGYNKGVVWWWHRIMCNCTFFCSTADPNKLTFWHAARQQHNGLSVMSIGGSRGRGDDIMSYRDLSLPHDAVCALPLLFVLLGFVVTLLIAEQPQGLRALQFNLKLL